MAGINQVGEIGRIDPQIGFADALQRVFPTTLASYLQFRDWIRQETLLDLSSVTFLNEATGPANIVDAGHMAQNGAPTHEIERQGRWKQGGGMVGRISTAVPVGASLLRRRSGNWEAVAAEHNSLYLWYRSYLFFGRGRTGN